MTLMEPNKKDLAIERYLTILRDQHTPTAQFRWAADNLARLLCSEAIAKLPHREVNLQTPVGASKGVVLDTEVMCVPIYRAGQALVHAFLEVIPEAKVGSLLIQRDESTARPKMVYHKFPRQLPKHAIILDPMLATAGSALMAVTYLLELGYSPSHLYFVGVIASQEGYHRLSQIITEDHITIGVIDPGLTPQMYIDPGLGDFGDRYFGTV
ncbi:MAG: uracil phosphoribosyltransferase [bacterium]|nr:uracil phosphoribosyltransferase [bacterium]